MQNIFNKLANVFESGDKPVIEENQQAYQNDFSSVVVDYVPGRRHQNYFEEGQDFSAFRCSALRSTIAVSDGCSSAKEALPAAKYSVEAALAFFQERDWPDTGADPASRQALVDEFVRYLQDALRASGKDYYQLCATLAVASYDRETGQYLVLNIGDGYVAGYLGDSICKVILKPFNRDGDSSRTCFGNSDDVAETTQLEIGNALEKRYSGFVICSDGASALFDEEEPDFSEQSLVQISNAAKAGNAASIHAKLIEIQSEMTFDDVSIGILMADATAQSDADKTRIADFGKPETVDVSDEVPAGSADDTDSIPDVLQAKLAQADVPAMVGKLIVKLFIQKEKLTTQQLIALGICKPGKVLSTMMPFIQADILTYQDDAFILKKAED